MGFLKRCEEAREMVSSVDNFLLVHHYDADGLSSGALTAAALEKMGKDYRRLCFRRFSQNEIEEINRRPEKNIIVVDFGSAQVDELEKSSKTFIVIDHHQGTDNSVLQINPRLFGIDGSHEMCSASAAYFVFAFEELAPMGVVGAVGDMQAPFIGWNRRMLEEGEAAGAVKSYSDLSMFGRTSRTLIPFLAYSIDPYLPGLTNNEHNVESFYSELGIEIKKDDKQMSYNDLSDDERLLLRSALAAYLNEKGRVYDAKRLIGEVYELLTYPLNTEMRDASECSTLLNACGRHNKPDIGVNTLLKRPGAYAEAKTLLEYHRRKLKEGIDYARKRIADFGVFYFLDGRGVIEDGIIGVVAGMIYGSIPSDKPVLAIALDREGNIKVSARATRKLTSAGINLGKALSIACEGIGIGGGHDIAAGATVEIEHLNKFLKTFGDAIENQCS